MSLRHWEATREALREELHRQLPNLTGRQLEDVSSALANVAIEAYTKSVYGPTCGLR